MAISVKQPLTDISEMYINMKLETSRKRLAYQESLWLVKEVDLIEDKRKLELRIAQLEQMIEDARAELIESSNKTDQTFSKMEIMQGQMKLLTEEKERTQRESLSLQKQLDYYKGETESLQKRMKEADNVLSEKMTLTRQVIALQLELENERRATVRTSKSAADNRDSEKSLQKEVTELKAQLAKQTQLTEKAKAEVSKVKEDWEKQKNVLETKLDKEKSKNKNVQEKKTGGVKRKAVDEQVVPSLLSPIKPSPPRMSKPASVIAPPPAVEVRKPVAKKAQAAVSEFSTTPFFARQASVMPQPSPSAAANTSIMGRSMPIFGGSKNKRGTSVQPANTTTSIEEPTDSTIQEGDTRDTSLGSIMSADTSMLSDMSGLHKKKKRKLNGGTGTRTLLAIPDESPAHGVTEFGVSTLMQDSPATRPKFAGNHLLSTVKKPKGGLLWNLKKGKGLKLDGGGGEALISPGKANDKLKDIKKGFTLKI